MDQPKRRDRAEYFRQYRQKNLETQRVKDREKQQRLRHADPEHYREYKREWRKKNRAREQERLVQKRQQQLDDRAAEERTKLGREPETLSEWLSTQSRFATEADLARAIDIKPDAVYRWRKGQRKASNQQRRKLFEITGLTCYADAANWKQREKAARKKWKSAEAPIVAQLIIRCGLAERELRKIRKSQIEADGIRLDNGRLVPFGDGWEHIDRDAVDQWIEREDPKDLLFFSLRPLDRSRPANRGWFRHVLRATGIRTPESRRIYMRHFVGDFARFMTDKDFLRHVRRNHGLENGRARAMLYRLREQKIKLAKGTLSRGRCKPEDAYDLFFLKGTDGRKRTAKKAPSLRTMEKGNFCSRFIADMQRIKAQNRDRGWSIAEIEENFPDLIAWKVRATLPEDDRGVFNHPRQWGAPVGYALNVLATYYQRDAGTVKNWVKASRRALRAP